MAGTFSQIYIQIVFAVKGRENLILKRWQEDLHKYIAGIVRNKEQKSIIVGGMSDHIHAIGNVFNYILNQENHHHIKTFKEEYFEFLKEFEIEFNEKYLFECY
jgi:REP element-mobilizing transposase RayT